MKIAELYNRRHIATPQKSRLYNSTKKDARLLCLASFFVGSLMKYFLQTNKACLYSPFIYIYKGESRFAEL